MYMRIYHNCKLNLLPVLASFVPATNTRYLDPSMVMSSMQFASSVAELAATMRTAYGVFSSRPFKVNVHFVPPSQSVTWYNKLLSSTAKREMSIHIIIHVTCTCHVSQFLCVLITLYAHTILLLLYTQKIDINALQVVPCTVHLCMCIYVHV